ncbi:MAG TPA: hypothetical protein VGF75_04590 [Candidatus Saccharimonadales bacterium]|jgi:hypothetical protein
MSHNKIPTRINLLDYSHEPDPETFDPLLTMFDQGSTMTKLARTMAVKYAVSYRGVKVGEAALTHSVEERRLRLDLGYNVKPNREAPTFCAEMMAGGQAISEGFARREAFFTAGPTDIGKIESILGVAARILIPCQRRCSDLPEDSTIVFSFGTDEDIFSVHTGQKMREVHPQRQSWKPRNRRDVHPLLQQPIFDLQSLDWPRAKEHYQDQMAEYDLSQFGSSPEDLRLVRATEAITALTTNVDLAAVA